MHIQWDESYEVGHPLLDCQHRLLVMLFNKLSLAITAKRPETVINRIITELRKFVDFHFISEENLMLETGYPDYDNHCRLHTSLMTELNIRISHVVSGQEDSEELLRFLHMWLIHHIAKHDRQIVEHVRQSRGRPIGEESYPQYLPH